MYFECCSTIQGSRHSDERDVHLLLLRSGPSIHLLRTVFICFLFIPICNHARARGASITPDNQLCFMHRWRPDLNERALVFSAYREETNADYLTPNNVYVPIRSLYTYGIESMKLAG